MKERTYSAPDYDQFIASDGAKTNWPADLPSMKDRRAINKVAVDVDGVTVCTCDSQEQAMEQARWYFNNVSVNTTTRPIRLTEEDFRQEDEARRERIWQEQIYKPTPARRMRR